jgi:hypothetical protein
MGIDSCNWLLSPYPDAPCKSLMRTWPVLDRSYNHLGNGLTYKENAVLTSLDCYNIAMLTARGMGHLAVARCEREQEEVTS